jgi:small subunit ribosomal protein S21
MMGNHKYNKRKQESNKDGLTVEVRDGNVEKAIRVLKKKVIQNGIIQEVRERQFYESKGTKRRKAKAAATRRYKRNMQKRKEELGY